MATTTTSKTTIPLQIQSIAIPDHLVPSSSSDPVLYQIRVSTPSSTYTKPHRYSEFLTLHNSLTSLAHPLPAAFPPKRSIFSLHSSLTEPQLLARRQALELYLRSILSSKNPIWVTSTHFQDFLSPPPSSISSAVHQQKEWTSQTWLTSQTTLNGLTKTLQALLARRDVLISSSVTSAQAHGVNSEAKKGLVDLLRGISELRSGLTELERRGMVQGEVGRRRDMIGKLEDEAETIGVLLRSGPKIGAGSRRPEDGGGPSAERNQLLARPPVAGPPAGRVLGGKAVETKETRALDNQGLIQLQQGYMDSQDQKLEELTAQLRRQRDLGNMIGQELEEQEETLRGLEREVDNVQDGMKKADKIMKKLG